MSEIVERTSPSNAEEEVSLKTEIIKQKEEMIKCLQDELIKVRLAEAENDETLRDLNRKVSELEEVSVNYTLFTLSLSSNLLSFVAKC